MSIGNGDYAIYRDNICQNNTLHQLVVLSVVNNLLNGLSYLSVLKTAKYPIRARFECWGTLDRRSDAPGRP